MRYNSISTHHLAEASLRTLKLQTSVCGFGNSQKIFNQDIASSLTFTPGAFGGRSGMGLSGTATSDSSIVSVLSSLSVSTLAEEGNTTTTKKKKTKS